MSDTSRLADLVMGALAGGVLPDVVKWGLAQLTEKRKEQSQERTVEQQSETTIEVKRIEDAQALVPELWSRWEGCQKCVEELKIERDEAKEEGRKLLSAQEEETRKYRHDANDLKQARLARLTLDREWLRGRVSNEDYRAALTERVKLAEDSGELKKDAQISG